MGEGQHPLKTALFQMLFDFIRLAQITEIKEHAVHISRFLLCLSALGTWYFNRAPVAQLVEHRTVTR